MMDPLQLAFAALIVFVAAIGFLSILGKEITRRERLAYLRYLIEKKDRQFKAQLREKMPERREAA